MPTIDPTPELMAGFIQGRRIAVEKKRLAQVEKEQTMLNDYRMRTLAMQEQEARRKEAQFGVQTKLAERGLDIREKQVEETARLKELYQEMINAYNMGRISQDQQELTAKTLADVSKQIGDLVTNEFMTPEDMADRAWALLQMADSQINALPIPLAEKQKLRAEAAAQVQEAILAVTQSKGVPGAEGSGESGGESLYGTAYNWLKNKFGGGGE